MKKNLNSLFGTRDLHMNTRTSLHFHQASVSNNTWFVRHKAYNQFTRACPKFSIFSQHLSSGLLYTQNVRKIMKRNSNLKNNAEKVTYNPSGYQPWVSWAALYRILHTNKAKNCHEDGERSYCHRATIVAVRHSFQIFEDPNAVVTITLLYP